MAEPDVHGLFSVEEYLEFEESSAVKHEYVGGMIFALAGASDRHNRIAGNIFAALREAARGGPCRVYISDMRLQVDDVFYYPDVMVACEPPASENPTSRHDPCLLVEVLSPSTEATDRREKLMVYRQIPNVKAYLIVDQDRRRVERHFRDEAGLWHRADLVDEGNVPVPCPPNAELTLAEIYEGL
ncbi:MAG: Uma2 family endonuclease [Rubrobacteraceae bacterium]